ncbi:peptide-methionine (R)-S-oxide reductase MsrB [Cognatilysobacter bugurensis]|uniref:peptide-methionine (R)-S-oxide reductase n=1 Tax=Cognatilysobacter bugurensis TaxID=543356 RepID=A0A918SZJ1_9GAMM|nr:peptide-methionine (R)-S-oxide reductase MsrB [Lysobacter bugurensis]GHA80664.1 peptide-methionine (R)-S-oxide reductase [Lysobacter bugurensis]
MNRRTLLQGIAGAAAVSLFSGCSRAAAPIATAAAAGAAVVPLKHPDRYWRERLSAAEFEVLFEEGTERAGSSPLDREQRAGTFVCAACYLPLFLSEYKFDSGTGWPSFTRSIAGHTGVSTDYKLILPRTEYHCARCGGHQGHIFDDGPRPRGERWCNNGVALNFVPRGQPLPALRG